MQMRVAEDAPAPLAHAARGDRERLLAFVALRFDERFREDRHGGVGRVAGIYAVGAGSVPAIAYGPGVRVRG